MRTRDEVDVQAAEHAIGLGEASDQGYDKASVGVEQDFSKAVATWRERFCELDATAVALPATQALWQRIASSLSDPAPSKAASASTRQTAGFFADIWQNLAFWRTVGLIGSAAAIAFALLLPDMLAPKSIGPLYVAVLMTDTNQPAAIVNTYRDGRVELTPLDAIVVPDGRSLQVWTLWDPARGPVSLGLLDRARSASLEVKNIPATTSNQLFEITLEPKQGSPTGRPTGPILMKGLTHTAL